MPEFFAEEERFYVTTPIYYVNDTPHIGHAYTSLACDALARFARLRGSRVHFLTGTDEHGQKVEKAARAAGEAPQSFTDRISRNFRDLSRLMNFSPDDFIRTTEPRHRDSVCSLWRRLEARGQIYLGSYSGWYAVRDEAFYEEREVRVDEDGVRRAPSGAEVEWLEEPSYFFRLSEWQERLLELYESRPDFILPRSRRNEIASFVEGGLRDLSVSRAGFSWGIRVPGDSTHVIYVWLDALQNYMSAVGGPPDEDGGAPSSYRDWWPADLHMVGKDILRFHSVYWPAFLLAADLPPPRRVFGHGWLLSRGRKMSKSEGNVLRPSELVARYGLDCLRYYLLREVPFGQDGYIGHESILARCNAELANGLGNLAQRSLKMVESNLGGVAPGFEFDPGSDLQSGRRPAFAWPQDESLYDFAHGLPDRMAAHMATQSMHLALEEAWSVIGAANRYFDEMEPWVLARTGDRARLGQTLAATLDTLRLLAFCLFPFMPDSSRELLRQLGDPVAAAGREGEGAFSFAALSNPLPSRALPPPAAIFTRLVDDDDK